jgi:hypothetical protein
MTTSKTVIVNDNMQREYRYVRTESAARNFHADFNPQLTPKQMLRLGVFGGKYMTDCYEEFPSSWFTRAKLSPQGKDICINYYEVDASLSLSHWKSKGWIHEDDPRGWFQWYCRYYSGRRMPEEDKRQIGRWNAMRRHVGAIKKNCIRGDDQCRKRQRQALLHWAYDARLL